MIPFNEHPGSGFERPSDEAIEAFHQELAGMGAHVLLRRSMGRDIFAACGQLTTVKDRPEAMDISNSSLAGMPKFRREQLKQMQAQANAQDNQ